MKKWLLLIFVVHTIVVSAQNVGVGTTTPAEKLDVNGNINVAGTIKVNGTDGTSGQVLMKNSSGNLAWGDMCDYKNMISFTTPGANSWSVPANVTKVLVEVWGAGGGGNIYAAGGGGGYIRAIFTVVPGGTIFYTVGAKGAGASTVAINGGESSATYSGNTVNAGGGFGANFTTPFVFPGAGGQFGAFGVTAFFGMNGQRGQPINNEFTEAGGAVFYEIVTGGNGGNAGNTDYTGAGSMYAVFKVTAPASVIKAVLSANGTPPGGGGGAGYSFVSSGGGFSNGNEGAHGMVIIHF